MPPTVLSGAGAFLKVPLMADEAAPRTCDICGVEDTAPHHVVYIIQQSREISVSNHIRCCAEAGCPACMQSMRKV